MKKFLLTAILFTSAAVFSQQAQNQPKSASAPPASTQPKVGDISTIPAVMISQMQRVEDNLVKMAEEMPEEKYSFAPSSSNGEYKGVRTFGEEIRHIAAINNRLALAILGDQVPVNLGPDGNGPELKSKAEIVKALKDSYAFADRAMDSIDQKNLLVLVLPMGFKQPISRLGMATYLIAHGFNHYGQVAEYFRMNGLVPPESR